MLETCCKFYLNYLIYSSQHPYDDIWHDAHFTDEETIIENSRVTYAAPQLVSGGPNNQTQVYLTNVYSFY